MQFGATPEQDMIVETVRSFVEQEIYPLEDEIEKLGHVPKSIAEDIKSKSKLWVFMPPIFRSQLAEGGLIILNLRCLSANLAVDRWP